MTNDKPPVLGIVRPAAPRSAQTPQAPAPDAQSASLKPPAPPQAAEPAANPPPKQDNRLAFKAAAAGLVVVAAVAAFMAAKCLLCRVPAAPSFDKNDVVTVIHPGAEFSSCMAGGKKVTRRLAEGEAIRVKSVIASYVGGIDSKGTFGTFLKGDVALAAPGVPAPPSTAINGHCAP